MWNCFDLGSEVLCRWERGAEGTLDGAINKDAYEMELPCTGFCDEFGIVDPKALLSSLVKRMLGGDSK
jgi:hypothetical protein